MTAAFYSDPPDLQFRAALVRRDIVAPAHLIADGKLHRCDAVGRGGKGDAAYVLHLDGVPAGGFQNWRDGLGWEDWRANIGRLLSPAEQEECRHRAEAAAAEREADKARRQAEAADRARLIWERTAGHCGAHPYLNRKRVAAHGVRLHRGSLLAVPLFDPANDRLWNLQFIGDAGSKRFLTGGRVKGCCFIIGEPGEVICIGEGFASCVSVQEATEHAVAIAFDCGNLLAVAKAMRARFPSARIVIAADDDYRTTGNPGLTKAREAAATIGGSVAVPEFGGNRPDAAKDFNDLAAHAGLDAVRNCIAKAMEVGPQPAPAAVEAEDGKSAGKLSQRDKLISVADRAQFWRCDEGLSHATIPVGEHHEHHRVRSQAFRDWLMIEAGREYPVVIAGKARPGAFGKNATEEALSACEAMAAASRMVMPARLRVNQHDGKLYLDLGDPEWRVVEIGPGGWHIVDRAPVPILRTRRTRALPCPIPGGSLAPLRALLPIESDDEWRIVILWALAALRPAGPYPILAWSGEQGTGKSFASRIMRRLIDPCGDDLMAPPHTDRDLIAAAKNNHVLAFDNLSSVSGELADSFCRLATGGDIGGCMLYTNDDSAAFAAQRPLLLNGIPDLVSRGDLASRTLFVRLTPMRRPRPESELWEDFNATAPGILGALLDVLSAALANLSAARLPEDSATFRMADFALLAIAAEPALGWPSGAALKALRHNSRGAASALADLDPVALAIRELVRTSPYTGLLSALHARLTELTDAETRRGRAWPKDATRLSTYLRRIAPALRAVGIDVKEHTRTGRGQPIEIAPVTGDVAGASPLSESWEEKRGGGHPTAAAGEVNKGGITATSATRCSANGRNAGLSAELDGVADVAECSYADAQLHRNSGNSGNGIGTNYVADVAVTDSSPTSDDPEERAAILEHEAGYPRPEAERLAGLQPDDDFDR
ncbi:MAG: toprim domain-containing protein [Rhodopila sp.]